MSKDSVIFTLQGYKTITIVQKCLMMRDYTCTALLLLNKKLSVFNVVNNLYMELLSHFQSTFIDKLSETGKTLFITSILICNFFLHAWLLILVSGFLLSALSSGRCSKLCWSVHSGSESKWCLDHETSLGGYS